MDKQAVDKLESVVYKMCISIFLYTLIHNDIFIHYTSHVVHTNPHTNPHKLIIFAKHKYGKKPSLCNLFFVMCIS